MFEINALVHLTVTRLFFDPIIIYQAQAIHVHQLWSTRETWRLKMFRQWTDRRWKKFTFVLFEGAEISFNFIINRPLPHSQLWSFWCCRHLKILIIAIITIWFFCFHLSFNEFYILPDNRDSDCAMRSKFHFNQASVNPEKLWNLWSIDDLSIASQVNVTQDSNVWHFVPSFNSLLVVFVAIHAAVCWLKMIDCFKFWFAWRTIIITWSFVVSTSSRLLRQAKSFIVDLRSKWRKKWSF